MKVCCIEGCDGPKDPLFFDFPTSGLLRKRWLAAVHPCKPGADAAVCGRHFARSDYEEVRGKTRLKSRVVPTLLIGDQPKSSEDTETSQESTISTTSNNKLEYDKDSRNDDMDKEQINNHVQDNNKNGKQNIRARKKRTHNNKKQDKVTEKLDNANKQLDNDNTLLNEDNKQLDKNNKLLDNVEKNDNKLLNNYRKKIDNDIEHLDNDKTLLNDNKQLDNATVDNVNAKTNGPVSSNEENNETSNNRQTENNNETNNDNTDNNNAKLDNDRKRVDNDGEKGDNDGKKGDNYSKKIDKDSKKANSENKNLRNNEKHDKTSKNKDKIIDSEIFDTIRRHNFGILDCEFEKFEKELNEKDKSRHPLKKRKSRSKMSTLRAMIARRKGYSSDSSPDSVSSRAETPEVSKAVESSKDDIERILTHYCIENKRTERQVAAMTDTELERDGTRQSETEHWCKEAEPVFVELSVGHGEGNTSPSTERDCLMVMESVQCDVDVALLLAARSEEEEHVEKVDLAGDDDDDDDDVEEVKRKEDPISLLTSSDEDDVIIQEPKIDTVEVSSADTSEDDMPLVKLVKPSTKTSESPTKIAKKPKSLVSKFLWGRKDFYCVHCRFTTTNNSEYTQHMSTHSKVLQLCNECGYTTCSKTQLAKHKRKHKNERKFQCNVCSYTARHKMSLVYHLKTHSNKSDFRELEMAICDTEPMVKKSRYGSSEASKKDKRAKKFACSKCDYRTCRSNDLKRHRLSKHMCVDDDEDYDDVDYIP